MSTRADHMHSDAVRPEPAQPQSCDEQDRVVKPRWLRPEITSFKPVADAQGILYRIGDGISNLS